MRNGVLRRAWVVLAAVVTTIGVVGVGPAGAKSSKPVKIDGKVNVKGTKDISSKQVGSIEIEADDYYFEPTFVKVQPGEKVRVTLENEGDATHTFTSSGLSIDQEVTAGKKVKFTLTVPSDGTAFEFHCSFHQSMGMQGALYTKAGGTAR
jgi:plastocyanin